VSAIHYAFDAQKREYDIDVAPGALAVTSLDMPWRRSWSQTSARGRGAFFNYDVHGVSGGMFADGPLRGYSGLFGGGVTVQGGTLTTNFVAQTGDPTRPGFALLDTTWQHDDVAHHATLQLGDAVSSGGTFGAELRYFGVGWSSNFDSDPNFVTSPPLALGGVSRVPSVVDLYVNNALTYSKDVPAGPFEINSLPTVNG
jgi:outer membrane usher protein